MQGQPVGFESSFRRHLDAEQRRAVLEAIGGNINPDSTLGEVVDAAEALGWSEQMGGLSLADLAEALLAPLTDETKQAAEAEDEPAEVEEFEDDEEEFEDDEEEFEDDEEEFEDDEEEFEDDEEEVEEEQLELTPPRKRGRAASKKKATKKKAANNKAAKKKSSKKTAKAASKKAAKKKSSKKTTKAASKKTAKKKPAKKAASKKKTKKRRSTVTAADVDDRMSLDQAADFFVPYVEELGEATMQDLEDQTGVARRKLRFHIGQLVRNGYLERHGMGRGTYYTLA